MTLQSIATFLKGYKTYFVSAMSFAFGLVGLYAGWLDKTSAVEFMLAGLGLGALRNGIQPPTPPTKPNADVGEVLPDTPQTAT